MESSNKASSNMGSNMGSTTTSGNNRVGKAAETFINEGKKLANELYEEGKTRVGDAEDSIKEYSDQLLTNVQKNPLTAILVAGGVGFLLSLLLKK